MNNTFYNTYNFLYKAWQRGDLFFEPVKPFNFEEYRNTI